MSGQQSLHLFTAVELAEELALRDAEMLRRISPTEIDNGAWMDKGKKHKLAPNILAMVHAFNTLAQIVATEILIEEHPQQRALVISTYIKIAKKCYELKNYNSLNALLAGLLCTPVYRLSKTWKEVSSKRKRQMRFLSKLMSEEGCWRQYRREIKQQASTNTTCVIFLGVFLSHAVRYDAYRKLKQASRASSHSLLPFSEQKVSMCETFTVLEAITVRNRLEQFRMSQCSRSELAGTGSVLGRPISRSRTPFLQDTKSVQSFNSILSEECEEMTNSDDEDRGQKLLLRSRSLNDDESPSHENTRDDDMSPDLPEVDEWSHEACHEVNDRMMGPDSQAGPSLVRGRSLEQLLQACRIDDKPLTQELQKAQSQSMPRLLSGSLQLWSESLLIEVADSTDIKDVPPIVAYTSSDSPPATMTQTELKITDNDVMGSDESKISTNGLEVCCIHQRRSSTVPPRVSFSTVDQHSLSTSSNRPRRSAFKSSLGLSRPMRKRYTTSDELTVLQLQGAKDEPSCDPAILLRQYQILSLGYSLTLTSSPYIQSLLTNYTPSSEAHNYRRSFLLEPA